MADRPPEEVPPADAPEAPPPPSDPRAPTELPRLPSAGSSRTGSARAGQPPSSAGLVREGLLGAENGLGRSASSPVLGTPPRSLGSRNQSRERLEPLMTSPPAPRPESESTPRRSQPQLTPLSLPGRPGSGAGSRPGSGPGTERDRPVGVPPLDLATAIAGATEAAGTDATAIDASAGAPQPVDAQGTADEAPELVQLCAPPPEPVETEEEMMARRMKARGMDGEADGDAPTARGPVKWVPHTHANPKHAKFCFICLHGRLEGQKDTGGRGSVSEEVAIRTEDEDLPPPTELKDLGYLLPGSIRFRRSGADYERCNLTAEWMKEVSQRMYGECVKGMLAKQNEDIIRGRDVKLVGHHEDLKDRELLERLFTLSTEEMDGLDQKFSKLATWCGDQESRLLDVAPEPKALGDLPEVAGPTPEQLPALEYKPLVDLAELKGDTANDARQAMKEADHLIVSGAKRGFDGFHVESLALPDTHPDMPVMNIVPYKISREDLPDYDRQQPQKPTRRPIEALADPYSRPFLFLPEFEETAMPIFEGTVVRGKPRTTKPLPAEELWLSKTRSVFPDNNVEGEEEYGWGMVPPRGRIMPPLVDDPYLPPDDLVDEGTGKKKYVVRSVWDPELFTQEGRMVPPIKDLARALYKPPPFSHPSEPIWSRRLAPKEEANKKVDDLVSLIPVYSFARFKPKRVGVTMPEFLWDLVSKDGSGQGVWDVIKQRHEIPMEIRKNEAERIRLDMEEEERLRAGDEGNATMQPSDADEEEFEYTADAAFQDDLAATRAVGTEQPAAGSDLQAVAGATASSWGGAGAARRVTEARDGLPEVEVEVPGPPRPIGETEGQAPASPKADARRPSFPEAADISASPMRTTQDFGSSASPMRTTQEHLRRVKELPETVGGAGRKMEEIISDDRFIDTLAEKICLRMGGAGAGLASPNSTMRNTQQGMTMGATRGSWAAGVLSGQQTLDGQATANIMRPEPPSFTEPVDESAKAELPRALQGNVLPKQVDPETQQGATGSDVNVFTQEKMRGECYVRLLVRPEEHAARKIVQPFRPETWAPDAELISKRSRPNIRMPPKPPVVSEDGEILEEDEYQDFERSSEIVFSFVRHNRYDAVEALIQQDQDVIHCTDESSNTLLHTACQNNNRRLTKLLLKNHIDINSQNMRGNTALHYCYQYGFSDLAEYLLAHGADDSILNQDGFVPAQGTGRTEKLSGAQHSMRTGG